MSTLSANNRTQLVATLTSARSLSTAKDEITYVPLADFTSANALYSITKTMAGASDTYNLTDSSLEDGIGDVLSFTHVCGIIFENTSSSNTLNLGTASSALPLFNSALPIARGGHYNWYNENGVVINSSVGNKINVGGSNGDSYKLIVIGIQ